MHPLGKVALGCFFCSLVIGIVAIPQLLQRLYLIPDLQVHQEVPFYSYILTNVLALAFVESISFLLFKSIMLQVALRSHFLGTLLSTGISTINYGGPLSPLGWYTCIMAGFHFSEYIMTSIIRPQTLSIDSFLLNHSKAYAIAAVASWIEFFIELWLVPGLKEFYVVTLTGVIICLSGEIIRKTAMLTASHNFDHLIRTSREDHHELVTTGIYGIWRHPSYVGWFYWSIGTQIIMCNPFCFVSYLIASWAFFKDRISQEELTLLHFFGDEYIDYQSRVPTGLPFIQGFLL